LSSARIFDGVKPDVSGLIPIFEDLRGRSYDGGYDAVRRYAGALAEGYG
jgi:hypothetical protein